LIAGIEFSKIKDVLDLIPTIEDSKTVPGYLVVNVAVPLTPVNVKEFVLSIASIKVGCSLKVVEESTLT
jgi:hypothetical protein